MKTMITFLEKKFSMKHFKKIINFMNRLILTIFKRKLSTFCHDIPNCSIDLKLGMKIPETVRYKVESLTTIISPCAYLKEVDFL